VSSELCQVHPQWVFSPDYDDRSRDILETALRRVPAYRSWQAFDPGIECPVNTRYASLPVFTKQDIRQHFPQGMTPADHDVQVGLDSGEISLVKTSGTVDISVTNIWNQKWWDASERASWRLNSHADKLATGNHHEAILANPMNVGIISDNDDLPVEKRRLARFLYLNEKTDPTRWTTALMDRMITELGDFKPAILEANPSFLARLCRYIVSSRKKVYQPGLIVLTYEYPTQFHYRQIRSAFTSPISSSYGTTETGYVFMQCEEGKFHQNSEFCRVDFQPLQTEHGGPFVGRILVTTFNNPWYYMLRFDVGDLVRIDETGQCSCGRNSGMILTAIEGRTAAVTLTLSGRLVTQRELDNALSILKGVDEYRLEQADRHIYILYLASTRPDKNKLSQEASAVLEKLYGKEVEVCVIHQDAISPESSGKYRTARTVFPVNIEPYLDQRCLFHGKAEQ
jgi:phenylacetate-coenzyme A ligase PaaK-like adenylate-forming protein